MTTRDADHLLGRGPPLRRSGGAASTNCVSRSSSSERSRNASSGSRPPISSAISVTALVEASASCSGARTGLDPQHLPHEHERAAASGRRARRASASRTAGSRRRSSRAGDGSVERVAEARHLVEQERRPEREVRALPVASRTSGGCRDRRRRRCSANSRLRDQPSGAWGIIVSVLRCTGRPDARAMSRISARSSSS